MFATYYSVAVSRYVLFVRAAAIFLCVSAGSFDISVFGLGWQYGMQSAIYGVVGQVVFVPWSNERPLENKELNAIIGAWFTLWRD
ncbi:hypothetical protein Tco_0671493 [Tanacetum coccineum]